MLASALVMRAQAVTAVARARAQIDVKILAAPILRLRGENLLSDSCVGTRSCIVVGSYQSPGGSRIGLVLTERSGTWQADGSLPRPRDSSASASMPYVPELSGVSCVSIDSCVAIANYVSSPTSRSPAPSPLILVEERGRWTTQLAPMPGGAGRATESLRSVACSTLSDCAIVGSVRQAVSATSVTTSAPVAVVLSNSTGHWAARFAPVPPDADRSNLDGGSVLASVSCPTAALCTAVGTYTTTSDIQEGLLLEQSGARWTSTRAPVPARGDGVATLAAISCLQTGDCDAVGSFDVAGAPLGFVLTRHAGIWTAVRSPNATVYNTSYGVSCEAPSSCLIAGIYLDGQYAQHGLLLAGAPAALASVQAPVPVEASADPGPGLGETLSSTSCSATFCEVVGTYVGDSTSQVGVVLTASLPASST